MIDWRPGASPAALQARAELLRTLRAFFAERRVLEVETPLVCQAGVTDPALEPLCVEAEDSLRFLQTSPEYAMKRLLAAGSGDIYQICKAFRAGEYGRRHNPEYTLLEWYRLNFNHDDLMREVAELVIAVLDRPGWQVWQWATLFQMLLGIDGLTATSEELQAIAVQRLEQVPEGLDRDGLLDLLMSFCIEPAIADWGVVFITDYPGSQASLARTLNRHGVELGARFECYVDGIELANGYWECGDPVQLRQRFEADNRVRCERGQPVRPIDNRLLAALAEAGLPDCAGVALGVDRLLALKLELDGIGPTLAFDWPRA